MPRIKLTSDFVKTARFEKDKVAPGADRIIWWDEELSEDFELSGGSFGLMVTKAGHKSFIVQSRFRRRSRRYAIEGLPRLAAARKQAIALLEAVANGRDPHDARRKDREAEKDTLRR